MCRRVRRSPVHAPPSPSDSRSPSDVPLDDTLLRLRRRDPIAQHDFFRHHHPRLVRLCLALTCDRAQAEALATDILEDFLLSCVDRMTSVGAIPSYLRTAARRRTARWIESGVRTEDSGARLEALPDVAVANLDLDPDERIFLAELAPRLSACLTRLTPKAREVLALRFGAGLANEAIGQRLGGSRQYIGKLITACLATLRACLEHEEAIATRPARVRVP